MTVRTVKLGDVIEINPRSNHSLDSDSNVAFLSMADISEDGQILATQTRPLSEVAKGYTSFQNGDVLLAKITPCFENGKAALVHGMFSDVAFGSTEFHVLRPTEEINGRYLYHLVWNPAFRAAGARRMTGSAGQKRVPTAFLSDFEIALPRFEEQKRIAAILDKADSLRRKREQAIRLTDDFLRAVFLDMFGDPATNPKGWPLEKLSNLCDVATGATPSRDVASYFDGPHPWIKTGEVDCDWIVSAEESISDSAIAETNCKLFPPQTILVAMYGQGKTRGKVGMLGIPAATNQACAAILPSRKVNTEFLFSQLRMSYEALRDMGRGGNQENLNLGMIKALNILRPPTELVSKYSEIRKHAIALSKPQREVEIHSLKLAASLQAKFFG